MLRTPAAGRGRTFERNGIGAIALLSAALLLVPVSAANAVASEDVDAPQVQFLSFSVDHLPASGGAVETAVRVIDETGTTGDVEVWFSNGSAVTPHVRAVLADGTDRFGVWTASSILPSEGLGTWRAHIDPVADTVGNVAPAQDISGPEIRVGYAQPPVRVDATAGSERTVHLTWPAPSDDGGSPITGYEVFSFFSVIGTVAADHREFDVDLEGSFPGDGQYSVAAVNAAGASEQSTVSPRIPVPATVASPPRDLHAVAGNGSAAVTWSAPLHAFASDVSAVRATARPGGASCLGYNDAGCTITGLTPGEVYSVTAVALNPLGASTASDEASVRVSGPPTAPGAVRVVMGVRTAQVSWTSSDTYSATDRPEYTVHVSPTITGCATRTTSCTVDDLEPGTSYRFTVTADNGPGRVSPASAPVTATAFGLPDPPTQIAVTSDEMTKVVVSWLPGDDGGRPITGYTVLLDSEDGAHREVHAGPGARSVVIRGLTPVVLWTVSMTATTAAGTSRPAVDGEVGLLDPTVKPSKPGKPVVSSATTSSMRVSWAAPPQRTGWKVDGYEVDLMRSGRIVARVPAAATTRSVGLSRLRPRTAYDVKVRAHNHAGWGPFSSITATRTR